MKFLSRILITLFAYSLIVTAAFAQSSSFYTISGQVVDEFGQAVAAVRVCAIPLANDLPGRNVFCGTSGDDGKFVIREREAGRFRLLYEKVSDGYMPQRWSFYRIPSVVLPEVTVDDQNPSASASVRLGLKSGALTGRAIDASTGLPLEDIQITLCRAADPKNCYQGAVKSADGKFRVLASQEPFTVRIAADGFKDWIAPGGSEKQPSPLVVASGESLELQVAMYRRKVTEAKAINDAEKQVGIYLPAPVQQSPADFAKLNGYPRATKLEWSPVEGAASYEVEVDYCRGGVREVCLDPHSLQLKSSPLMETSLEFNFIGEQPGRWRVWAIDKDGREGFKSPWRVFIYVR
jgi:hypothetical protein